MKIILHMAISVDGFVAKKDGDSDWVSPIDEELFQQRCREAGCVIVGRKTYQQYKGEIYPVKGATTIVLTKGPRKTIEENVLFASSPQEALTFAPKKGFHSIVVAGGAIVSG